MHKIWYLIGCFTLQLHGTQVFIKNWGTSPVIITQVSKVPVNKPNEKKVVNTQISIQPGQSLQLKHEVNNEIYTNFDKINISFIVNDYKNTETVFFPDEANKKATLSFTDSGYKRFPYNAINKK
ncbi:MAG: hypothetical protein WD055_06235 [Candidatus Dependentiae bacterium]